MKLLFCGTPYDMPYISFLKNEVSGHICLPYTGRVNNLSELSSYIAKEKIDAVITSSADLILLLSEKKKVTVGDYAGSVFRVGTASTKVLCINPLEQCVTTRTGSFILNRFMSKVTKPEKWLKQSELVWEIATESSLPCLLERFREAIIIAVDIETSRAGLMIDISGYCALFKDGTTFAICIKMDSELAFQWAQKFNELPAAKLMQNGGYDNTYFLRWAIPPTNYLWDTMHLFHSWYSEMPKSLDFLAAFLLPEFIYWKDESTGGTEFDSLFYNAKDTWATMNCFLSLMKEMPKWAKANYLMEFPLVFPSIHCGLEGFAIDSTNLSALMVRENKKLDDSLTEIRSSLRLPEFNPSSPVQVKSLIKLLGCSDLPTSGASDMKKCGDRHPLNDWFMGRILKFRKARKLISTYLEAELLGGRYMYSLNAAATDTGRLASSASPFWCGGNIQNISRAIKAMYAADPGWLIAECDKSQSEDRCVAVLSGDKGLLDIYAGTKDSHALKAEMFFGIPYDEIIRREKEAKASNSLELTIRDLSKRVNHGANYNMGDYMLLETMGLANILTAKKLLGININTPPIKVAASLLAIYDKAFPKVKTRWYNKIILDVATAHKLVGATGWTRFCFGNTKRSKQELNAYVAHVPQSLSVMIVNAEFMNVWRWAVQNPDIIRLKAQIHDSILFQYKEGREDVVAVVNGMMQSKCNVVGSDGITRELAIPTDVKLGMTHWGKL